MANRNVGNRKNRISSPERQLTPEQYQRLKVELKTPYRSLRKFVYFAFGASGTVGALVFLAQLLAGRQVGVALPNFALQLGIVTLMIWLFRLEQRDQ